MCSVWNSVLPWVFLCLFSSRATANDELIVLKQERETKKEGSCVEIDCSYRFKEGMQLLWLKDSKWNTDTRRYDGTIVYSNTESRPQVPEYSDRVQFFSRKISNAWSECSLQINDLKMNDSGKYSFRFIKEEEKYMSSIFNLRVMDNPCKVHIKPPNLAEPLKEDDTVSLHCATSAACESHPNWQISGSSEVLGKENSIDAEKFSELKLTLSWKDDGKALICRPTESQAGQCLDRNVTLAVEYAPKETKVTESSNSKDVKEGEQVTISCSSRAKPNANFTWFKRQSTFSQPGETLTLHAMTPEVGGTFYCQAKNEHGHENSTDIKINVIYAPKDVNISPTFQELREGETLTLTCLVQKSKPTVEEQSYRWYKDGREISHQTTRTFTVPYVTQVDKGSYQCQARNSVGQTMSTNITQISVKYVPQNTNIDGRKEIKLGFSLNLKCVTEADPLPINYCWYFKPEHEQRFRKLSDTRQMYSIEKVAVSNAGVYKCSAQNVIGTGANSSEVNVLVLYPPKKPNLTMKQVVKENEVYSIICTVESSPRAELTLSRSSLTNQERETMKTVQSNFFNFTAKASVQNAGTYTCTAKNSEGQNSSNDHLKVLYAPKNVKASAYPGEELNEGSELKLTCKADSVPQVSSYTWKKSFGKQSVVVGHERSLTLSSVKSSDSDHYWCNSSNEIGSAESAGIYIRVKYRPRITIIHNITTLSVLEKEVPVHLSCSVQSDPPVYFLAWYKLEENTTVLSNDQNYTVQPQNPGTYYCDAKNEVGKSRSEPVKISPNDFIIVHLIQTIICLTAILILIGFVFLLRAVLRKRCLGTNEAAQRTFFFSAAPWSNLHSSGSRNNTRENLVMERSSEISGFRDNYPGTVVHSNPPINRNTQAGSPNYNIHTTYDVIKMPPTKLKQHHNTEEDMTTMNYAMLQVIDSNNPNKSVPSSGSCGPVYAKVFKKKQMSKEQQGAHEDYENVSGVCTTKQPLPNIYWDSDSTESEDKVNYTKVSFTATSHHNPQKDIYNSDEEEKTEYTEVKI